jgi:hypothetical protein
MTEHTCVATLLKTLRKILPDWVILKLADKWTYGIPDISATGSGISSWWECKHANPDFKSQGIQELTAMRLAKHGICYYVIFVDKPKSVLIVHPKDIKNWETSAIAQCEGFDYEWVVNFIIKTHHDRRGLSPLLAMS